MIETILNELEDFLQSFLFDVIVEPTTPVDVGQVAVFYTGSEISDAAYPNQYRITSRFEVIFVESTLEQCISKISTVMRSISPSVLGVDCVVNIEGTEKRAREEGEPYFAVALLLSFVYFADTI